MDVISLKDSVCHQLQLVVLGWSRHHGCHQPQGQCLPPAIVSCIRMEQTSWMSLASRIALIALVTLPLKLSTITKAASSLYTGLYWISLFYILVQFLLYNGSLSPLYNGSSSPIYWIIVSSIYWIIVSSIYWIIVSSMFWIIFSIYWNIVSYILDHCFLYILDHCFLYILDHHLLYILDHHLLYILDRSHASQMETGNGGGNFLSCPDGEEEYHQQWCHTKQQQSEAVIHPCDGEEEYHQQWCHTKQQQSEACHSPL